MTQLKRMRKACAIWSGGGLRIPACRAASERLRL